MKTFTKFFALLFAFAIISSMSLNAQAPTPPWVAPEGDMGEDLMEIWVYGSELPTGVLNNGDQIAAFDGDKLVGLLTVSGVVAPSTTIDFTNWISNRLLVFSKDIHGNDLYQAGNPIILKAYNGTNGVGNVDGYAYTWAADPSATAKQIDFHNIWYAPTGDSTGFVNQGPFFPSQGTNSYCYVDLDFTATGPTFMHDIPFVVKDATGTNPVENATITSGGYTATTDVNGQALLTVFEADGINYSYTFTIEHASHDTEIVTVTFTGDDGTVDSPTQNVFLDAYGSFGGTVYCYDEVSAIYDSLPHGAVVSTTIGDVVYSDFTDINGVFLIDSIPDGSWYFNVTFPQYTTWDSIDGGGDPVAIPIANATPQTPENGSIRLDRQKGSLTGKLFNAVTLQTIEHAGGSTVTPVGGTAANWVGDVYTVTEIPGTYDMDVTATGYQSYTFTDYLIQPETTTTENFNLLPTGYTFPNYAPDPVTGDPNNMWTIHIETAKFGSNSFLPFDRIAIYDTMGAGFSDDVHVGTIDFDKSAIWQNSGTNVLKAFAVLNTGDPGFVPGHGIRFNAFDVSQNDTVGVPISWSIHQTYGTYHGNTFPNLTSYPNPVSYLTISWDFPSGVLVGTVTKAENPNIGDPISGVTVNVLNQFTQEIVATGTTDGSGQYNIPMDAGIYDVRYSVANYKTDTLADIEVVLGNTTTADIALYNRLTATQVYDYTEQGFYFFGRCVGSASTDMLARLDVFTAPTAEAFSTTHLTSWVENDGTVDVSVTADRLTHITGDWEPLTTDGPGTFDWELLEGYQLYIQDLDYHFAAAAPEYIVEPEDNPILLPIGIHYVPYFPWDYSAPDDAITAFAGILDSIDWVMDSRGDRLHKDNGYWIDNIGTLSPEEGYKIKVHHQVELTYPAYASKSSTNRVMLDPVHFIYNEGNAAEWTYTMNINTDDFEIGDEIAAYSNGNMVGSMVIDSDEAWENDLNTFYAAVDGGYEINSPIVLKAWDASSGFEYDVEFTMEAINDNAYIGINYPAGLDHFSYVNVTCGTVRIDENQVENNVKLYPNPTNGTLNIESVSNINQVHIFNIYGALVAVTNVNAKQQSVDVSNYASGTYMVQLHTDTGVITKRVIIK